MRNRIIIKQRQERNEAAGMKAGSGILVASNAASIMAGLFGAPVLLLLAMDSAVGVPYGCFDAGLFAQTIALAAHNRGLATCIMTSTLRSADVLHQVLPEAEGRKFIAAITLGHPDPDAPVNQFPRERVTLDDFVTRVG